MDCGIVSVVDFSDLSIIRSLSRYLLGFLRIGEWGRSDLGLFYCDFRVEWVVSFVLILLGLSEGECRMRMGENGVIWGRVGDYRDGFCGV